MWAVAVCGAIVCVAEPLTIALLRRLVLPISVAALMTPNWVARHLDVPGGRSSHTLPTPRESVTVAAGMTPHCS